LDHLSGRDVLLGIQSARHPALGGGPTISVLVGKLPIRLGVVGEVFVGSDLFQRRKYVVELGTYRWQSQGNGGSREL